MASGRARASRQCAGLGYVLPLLETVYYLAGMRLETPRRHYGARYASITFTMRSRAARLTEGSERSRPT